ncbi:unnamed protein product [Trypanosoma congolense IL3000]|uniref:WGS project CAEQ00000000 data, annotated contig 1558 n=1 Tax=Trypanosoma congolense (strain IL3000) TaxID=1068625 RepID=F9W736_TRYCI|nr:unnamed protein product [Trypanosoma congolense IL3000]
MSPVWQSYFRPIHTSPSISLCPTLTAAGQVVATDGGHRNALRQMVLGSHTSLAGLKPTHIIEHSAHLSKAFPFTTSGTFSGSHTHTHIRSHRDATCAPMDAATRSHAFASRRYHRLPTQHIPQPPERFVRPHQPHQCHNMEPYAQPGATLLISNGAPRAQISHFHFPLPDKANSPRTNTARHDHKEKQWKAH